MNGKVLSVETRNLAEPAMAAAAVAATTIYVADASTFDENGGLITVGDETLAYTATDVDANTITLAVGLTTAIAEQDPIVVYPPTPVRTALVSLNEEGGDVIPATVSHSLLDRLADGTRDDTSAETVTLEQRGSFEYVVEDLVGETLVTQSLDYVEAEEGIGLSEAVAQVQDLNALGQVNATGVTADTINLGGADLTTMLNRGSIGKLLGARLAAQASNIALSTTNTKILELNCGIVPGGRTYRISTAMVLDATAPMAFGDRILFEYRYTVDGTTPTVSSPEMDGGINDNSYQSGDSTTVRAEAELDVATTAPLRIALCCDVISGSGAYTVYAQSSARSRPVMSLYDDGPSGTRNDAAITLTGAGVSRFVKTYNATWAFGIDGSYGGVALYDSYLYIGGVNDACGFVGFDSASMVAQLAAATTPVSCVVRWRPRSRQTAAGLDARLATHNFSSSAAAAAPSGGIPFNAYGNLGAYGLTLLSNIRNNGVPGTLYEESLGTTVFNQFKAGSRKGVAFLGTPAASVTGGEGTIYGDNAYEVQLVFTYDGTS